MARRNHRRPRRAFLSLMDGLEERTPSAAMTLGILPAAFLAVADAAAASARPRDDVDPRKAGFTPAKPDAIDATAPPRHRRRADDDQRRRANPRDQPDAVRRDPADGRRPGEPAGRDRAPRRRAA